MKNRNYSFVLLSIFISIIILQTFIPILGYIPVGIMNATIIQVTVAIGAIVLGYKKGMILGLFFGLSSLVKNTLTPNPSSFLFSPFIETINGYRGSYKSLIISILPRVIVGFIAGIIYLLLSKKYKKISLILAGLFSSLTNSVLVLSFIFIFYAKEYSGLRNITYSFNTLIYSIMGIIFTQGILEAIISSILCLFIGNILIKISNIK